MQTQKAVVDWFDSTYRRKGTRYLRPVRAYFVFLELLGARPEHRLLDVACGPGVLLRAASEYTAKLHGIDISPVAIEQGRRGDPECRAQPSAMPSDCRMPMQRSI